MSINSNDPNEDYGGLYGLGYESDEQAKKAARFSHDEQKREEVKQQAILVAQAALDAQCSE